MVTRWILGDQLSKALPIIKEANKQTDVILFIEAMSRSTWQRYHKQKLVFIFSAMRHFAEELRAAGFTVDYRQADSFSDAWEAHLAEFQPTIIKRTVVTDSRMNRALEKWERSLPNDVEVIVESDRPLFLLTQEEACAMLPGNGPWKMDLFYRKMRKKYDILLEGGKPIGGKWSYDAENRHPAKSGMTFPAPQWFSPDAITSDVMRDVQNHFPHHPGNIDYFAWPVTREQALSSFNHFIEQRLPTFGRYQDAMLVEKPFMSHSLLSASINIGLLNPLEVIKEAELAYTTGKAPIASVEGFIRQILGWREYIRAVYLKVMPSYRYANFFQHHVDLPSFFWDGATTMKCVEQTIKPVIETAYGHHIQRFMVLLNFANLFGISPKQTTDWFYDMYIDAHDWVVVPNVIGMALFADGGRLATKPYIASGKYIQKMSNYCQECTFNVAHQLEEDACPFNALYWDFIDRHQEKLQGNQRMMMTVRQWERMKEEKKQALRQKSEVLKEQLQNNDFHQERLIP